MTPQAQASGVDEKQGGDRRPEASGPRRRTFLVVLVLLALAAGVRLVTRAVEPLGTGPASVAYKGDAHLWTTYARSLQREWSTFLSDPAPHRFELGLPLRPPGMAWLLAAIWDGRSDMRMVRILWLLLGSLAAPLLYLAARGPLGEGRARFAGLFMALASGPVLLATSLNNETPYLVVVLASMLFVGRGRPLWQGALWGALSAVAALLRAEHLAVFAVLLVWRAWGRWRPGQVALGRLAGGVLLPLLLFALVVAPWQRHAWREVRRFNHMNSSPVPAARLHWDRNALERIAALPGFCRGSTFRLVEDIVAHRGGGRVGLAELGVVEEACGYWPEPLAAHPLIATYGPLNFALANNRHAAGGFDRSLLSDPPPLTGGAGLYPPTWLRSLPLQGRLAYAYPPHLKLLNRGYAVGLKWIGEHPGAWLSLVGAKLGRLWSGAAHGLGAGAFPLGLSGVRHRVDLVTPEGGWARVWRLLLLALALYGLLLTGREPALRPWLLWGGVVVLVTVAFFGYARQGALLTPLLGLLLAGVWERHGRGRRVAGRLGVTLVVLVLLLSLRGLLGAPRVHLEGRGTVTAPQQDPAGEHDDRRLTYAW